jgi:Rod binding domain-containing protein
MKPVPGAAAQAAPAPEPRARLRAMAHAMEALFLAQMLQAMRATIPVQTETGDAGGRALYESMLDDRIATQAAGRSQRGLGEALYRQLVRRMPGGEPPVTPT